MSYTEIFGFDKKGNAYIYRKVKDAFKGAMTIWGILEERWGQWIKDSGKSNIKKHMVAIQK